MLTKSETWGKAARIAIGSALLGGLLACSDNDDDRRPAYGGSSSSSSSQAAASNIVEVAAANGSFTTLLNALQSAGLDDELSDPNASVTVFAPTDAAFAALQESLGEEAYNALLGSDQLDDILLYHVVGSEIDAQAAIAANGSLLETLNGTDVAISYVDETVMVNDASVTIPDVAASNGIIHVIDKVIVPPSETIADLVVAADNLSTLEVAVITADLAETLAGSGPYTVFAPTDEAFAKLGQETIDAVLADADLLTNLLTYHVFDGKTDAATVAGLNGSEVPMLNEEGAVVSVVDGDVYIDRAKVSVTNVLASNGVVHIIDSVMKPAGVNAPDGDVIDVLVADDNFSTLVAAVTEAELVSTLQGDGPFTVFAPTDDAFEQLPEGTLEALLADTAQLADVLTYHVFSGSVDSSAAVAAAGSSITMLNGQDTEVTLESGELYIDGARVLMTDIVTSNGVIHVIDAVMVP